jgi:hypothetical protein
LANDSDLFSCGYSFQMLEFRFNRHERTLCDWLRMIFKRKLDSVKEKHHINVPRSRVLLMVPDPTRTLLPHECYISLTDGDEELLKGVPSGLALIVRLFYRAHLVLSGSAALSCAVAIRLAGLTAQAQCPAQRTPATQCFGAVNASHVHCGARTSSLGWRL